MKIGDIYESRNFGPFVIKGRAGRKVTVEFLDTGTVVETYATSAARGQVKDRNKPNVVGVGFIGEGHYSSFHNGKKSPAMSVWTNMLNRCYNESSKKFRSYGAKGVVVCEEWHNYQNFAEWFWKNYKSNQSLDKDILHRNSKVYSPKTCTFVPKHINNLVFRRRASSGDYPIGVTKPDGKYIASITKYGKSPIILGYFDSMHDAFVAYKTAKEDYIKEVAEEEFTKGTIEKEVYDALLRWEVYPY